MKHWIGKEHLDKLIAEHQINLGDVGILHLLLDHMHWKTGRIHVTASALAKRLNRPPSNIRRSIGVLMKQKLITRYRDPKTGIPCFVVDPLVASVGSTQQRAILTRMFEQASDIEVDVSDEALDFIARHPKPQPAAA